MSEFYEVHCTNCGNTYSATKMAVDIDKLINIHLSKMLAIKPESIYAEAADLFREIRIGMYMTVKQMTQESILDTNYKLKVTGEFILKIISQRYHIPIPNSKGAKKKSINNEEQKSSGDIFDDINALMETEQSLQNDKKDNDGLEKELDTLCLRMNLYKEKDIKAEDKRTYIKKLLLFLKSHPEVCLLECTCNPGVARDDMGREFISSVHVTFIDGSAQHFRHMVCPCCGEPFFIDAGKYEEKIVVMLGSSRVGKTAYLAALVNEINPEHGRPKYPGITLKDTTDARYVQFRDSILIQYRKGMKIQKTPETKEAVALFSLELVIGSKNIILTLVDMPGEVFVPRADEEHTTGEASGEFIINHRKICYSADAFWFCIDPVQIDDSLRGINEENDNTDKVERDMSTVLANIKNMVETMLTIGKRTSNDIPTALIITKSDLISPEYKLYSHDSTEEGTCLQDNTQFRVDKLRPFVKRVGNYMTSEHVNNLLPQIEQIFKKKNFFSVAAYGRNVTEEAKAGDKAPYGIMLPFLWTMAAFEYLDLIKIDIRTKSEGFFHKKTETISVLEEAAKDELYICADDIYRR